MCARPPWPYIRISCRRFGSRGEGIVADRSDDWYAQAERDLESARWQLEGEFHEWACFACQQAAEKALKGVYQKMGGEAWGHSVRDLLRGLADRVSVDDDLMDCGRRLDRHYVPARYPNGWESGSPMEYHTEEDARDAVRCAERILRFCHGLLAGAG